MPGETLAISKSGYHRSTIQIARPQAINQCTHVCVHMRVHTHTHTHVSLMILTPRKVLELVCLWYPHHRPKSILTKIPDCLCKDALKN
jgi:hypothetical protein